MSRERALIKRATEALKYWMDATSHSVDWELLEDLESYLSTPEPTQDEEPVAWTNRQEINALTEECTVYMYAEPMEGEDNIPLFLHPAQRPDFVRLSEEEIFGLVPRDYMEVIEFARAIENALEQKNTINKSDPDSVDLQSRCRGDKP